MRDTLTEADVLKFLPIAYRVAPTTDIPESEWVIICAEKTEFVIELTDGKFSSRSATFRPAAKSKDLTLERLRELKDGMSKEEVKKLFRQELHRNGNVPTGNGIQRWRYVRGRQLEESIAHNVNDGMRAPSNGDRRVVRIMGTTSLKRTYKLASVDNLQRL